MLAALAFTLMMQQAAGTIVWEDAPAASTAAETVVIEPVVPATTSTLPAWATADPFAWERSQCSPLIRKEPSQEACQARVRTELSEAMGDRLPRQLRPTGLEACERKPDGAGGFVISCAPPERTASTTSAPPIEICEQRPRATGGGGVSFEQVCRPAGESANRGGLSFKLLGGEN